MACKICLTVVQPRSQTGGIRLAWGLPVYEGNDLSRQGAGRLDSFILNQQPTMVLLILTSKTALQAWSRHVAL
jgi:hypothetical protein